MGGTLKSSSPSTSWEKGLGDEGINFAKVGCPGFFLSLGLFFGSILVVSDGMAQWFEIPYWSAEKPPISIAGSILFDFGG